jgi:hypothetical protein
MISCCVSAYNVDPTDARSIKHLGCRFGPEPHAATHSLYHWPISILKLRKKALARRLDSRFEARNERGLLFGRAAAKQHFRVVNELTGKLSCPLIRDALPRFHAAPRLFSRGSVAKAALVWRRLGRASRSAIASLRSLLGGLSMKR